VRTGQCGADWEALAVKHSRATSVPDVLCLQSVDTSKAWRATYELESARAADPVRRPSRLMCAATSCGSGTVPSRSTQIVKVCARARRCHPRVGCAGAACRDSASSTPALHATLQSCRLRGKS